MLDYGGVVKQAVNVGADAVISLEDLFVRVAYALVDFVAVALVAAEGEGHLPCGLGGGDGGVDGQQAESSLGGGCALQSVGVADGLSQHLVAAADAHHGDAALIAWPWCLAQ